MNLFKLTATLGIDMQEFENSVQKATKEGKQFADTTVKNMETVGASTKSLSPRLSFLTEAMSKLGLKSRTSATEHKVLTAEIKEAKEKVKTLSAEYVRSARETGSTSDKTRDLQKKLAEAKKSAESLKGELNEYPGVLGKAKNAMGGLGKAAGAIGSAGAKGFALLAKGVAGGVAAAAGAVSALGAIGLNYNAQMETYTTNFKVMLGSSEQAVKKVEELKKFAASTPFGMEDLASATQTLLAFNVSSDDTNSVLQQLGDISLGNSQKLESLTRAYGKMNAAQKVTLEDINMMIDAGYNPLLQIQEQTGESMTDLYSRISEGKVSFEEIQGAIASATAEGGQFYKGMEEASKTTKGLISTLKDNAMALVGEVFIPISEGIGQKVLPGAINAISSLTNAFRENGISGIIDAASEIITNALTTFTEHLPDFLGMAFQIIDSLVTGISQNLPQITDAAITTVATFVGGILARLPQISEMAFQMIERLGAYLVNNMPEIVNAAVKLFTGFIDKFVEWLPKLIPLALQIVVKLGTALIDNIPELAKSVVKLGKAVVDGIIDGISAAWDHLVSWFNNLWDGLFGGRNVNVNVNQNVSTSGSAQVNGSHATGLDYVPFDGYIAELHKGERVLTRAEAENYGSDAPRVSVVQNIYSEAKTAADLMEEALYQQERAVILGV